MWGYRDAQGRIVATNPGNMAGNTGWEEVPEGTAPEAGDEPEPAFETTLEERVLQAEAALIELAAMVAGGE